MIVSGHKWAWAEFKRQMGICQNYVASSSAYVIISKGRDDLFIMENYWNKFFFVVSSLHLNHLYDFFHLLFDLLQLKN